MLEGLLVNYTASSISVVPFDETGYPLFAGRVKVYIIFVM